MKAHPAADLFPMLDDARLTELAEDIKARGLLDPIVLHDGMILDGRNRDGACEKAGVAPRYVEWDGKGGSPVLFVLSRNLQRRDLTPSQRAVIGAAGLEMDEAEGRARKAEAGRSAAPGKPADQEKHVAPGPHVSPGHESASSASQSSPGEKKRGPLSRDKAAAKVGASGRQVARAKRVKQADATLFEAVRLGERTLKSAEHEVRQREKQEQAERRIAETPRVDVRLLAGDATALPLAAGSVDVILTSPPYGLDKPYLGQTDLAVGWETFMTDWLREAYRVARAPGRLILNVPMDTAKGYRPTWPQACAAAQSAGWTYRSIILWDKMNSTKGNRGLGSENSADAPYPVVEVEAVGLFSKGDWKLGDDRPSDIKPDEWQAWGNGLWQLPGESRGWEGHPAPFPEALVRRLLIYLTRVGDTVLDPFSGSGTTALVARRLKREPIGVDRSLEYVASAVRRIAADDDRRSCEGVTQERAGADLPASPSRQDRGE